MRSFTLRLIILISALSAGGTGFGQRRSTNTNVPFQVLFVEGVVNQKGSALEKLEMIGLHDTLTVKPGGILSLVHYSGFAFEVEGDTTLIVENLHYRITGPQTRRQKRADRQLRPPIKYLFITDVAAGQKARLSAMGSCHDCNLNMEVYYPPNTPEHPVTYAGDLCLRWKSDGAGQYEVKLSDHKGVSRAVRQVTSNAITFSAAELHQSRQPGRALFVQIRNLDNGRQSSLFELKEYTGRVAFPYACRIRTATEAILVGLDLELKRFDYLKEAGEYFELATTLSDRPAVREIRENFRRRRQ